MRILCIDTSLGASVALWDDCSPTPLLASRSSADSRSHAEHLSDLVSQVIQEACGCALAKAGIEAVAVGRGPAPFTGLRSGLVTARTIGFALGIPVIGISSLDALARAVIAPSIARMDRMMFAYFGDQKWVQPVILLIGQLNQV